MPLTPQPGSRECMKIKLLPSLELVLQMVPALYQAPSISTESPLGGYAKYLLFVLPNALSNLLHPTLFLRRLTCIDHINALPYLWLFSVGFGQWELPAGVNMFIFLFSSLEGYFGLAQSFNNITAPPNAFSIQSFWVLGTTSYPCPLGSRESKSLACTSLGYCAILFGSLYLHIHK